MNYCRNLVKMKNRKRSHRYTGPKIQHAESVCECWACPCHTALFERIFAAPSFKTHLNPCISPHCLQYHAQSKYPLICYHQIFGLACEAILLSKLMTAQSVFFCRNLLWFIYSSGARSPVKAFQSQFRSFEKVVIISHFVSNTFILVWIPHLVSLHFIRFANP